MTKPLIPLPKSVRLLSLDASSTAIGYAMFINGKVEDLGVIRSPGSWDALRRIKAQTAKVKIVADTWFGRVEVYNRVVMEWQSHKHAARRVNAQGLAVLGQAQGYLYRAMEDRVHHSGIDHVSEREWTKQFTRNVPKEARFIQAKLLCIPYLQALAKDPKFDPGRDISDAICLGVWRLSIKH